VAIAVPTEIHYTIIHDLIQLENKPRLIMAEKPFCFNQSEAESIVDLLRSLSGVTISIAVNYTRRYDTAFQTLKKSIDENELGEIYSCVVYYDRGLQRDGCHAIDICNYLFGRFTGGSVLAGRRCIDYSKQDISFPAHLTFSKCGNVVFIPCDGRAFSIFEIDIIAEKGRFRFVDHGLVMKVYRVEPEKTYGNYNSLSIDSINFKTDLTLALTNYVNNVVGFLNGKEELICTSKDALGQHKIYEYLTKGVLK
jgi:predicted dehydrogenase